MQLLTMPRLGQTMDRGTVLLLAVAVDEMFDTGQLVYEVETEKVEVPVEAKVPGRVVRWLVAEGDELDVGERIAVVADVDERPGPDEIDRFLGQADPPTGVAATPPDSPVPGSEAIAAGRPSAEPTVRAMPKARAVARERGVDLADVASTVDGRAITVADVEQFAASRTTAATATVPTAARREPLEGHRRAMARQTAQSWSTIPHFHESMQIDAGPLLARRRAAARDDARPPTVTAYLVEALALACSEVPVLHATLDGMSLLHHDRVDMSVAVDTQHGLVAPVLHGVDGNSVEEIARRLSDLATRARERRLGIEEVEGGRVTLSNLGTHGVEIGVPVIPPGQVSLLFAGSIAERAVVVDGAVAVRPTVWLTLACDHRVVDGATAARALSVIRARLQVVDPTER